MVRGLLLVYVDDLLVMGDAVARPGLLKCIQSRWKTSTPETVDDQGWVRFCGYELKSHEGGLLLGQPSYLGELLQRHIVDKKTVPLPKDAVPPPEVEEGVTAEEIKKAQGIVGEWPFAVGLTCPMPSALWEKRSQNGRDGCFGWDNMFWST